MHKFGDVQEGFGWRSSQRFRLGSSLGDDGSLITDESILVWESCVERELLSVEMYKNDFVPHGLLGD